MAFSEQGRPSGDGGFRHRINSTVLHEAVTSKSPSIETDGFRGPMASLISEFQRRGLGRAIGVPLVVGDVTYEDEFRGIMYALPFSGRDKQPIDKSLLLLFPTEEKCRFLVVNPQRTFAADQKQADAANKESIGQFDALFMPSRFPYIDPAWRPNASEDSANLFIKAVTSIFPYVRFSHEIYDEKGKERALREALVFAMDMEAKKIPVDDASLMGLLGDSVATVLVELGDEFGAASRAKQAENNARRKVIDDAVDSMSSLDVETILGGLDF